MRYGKAVAVLLLASSLAGMAVAQEESEVQRKVVVNKMVVGAESASGDLQAQMRDAEARLEEAARQIAELSGRQMPSMGGEHWEFDFPDRPVLGITIGSTNEEGPVTGVAVRGVSPGGAAFDAGLRAGDTITAINKQLLRAENSVRANEKLLEFMSTIKDGDNVDVEYSRAGKVATVAVKPKVQQERFFAIAMAQAPGVPPAPGAPMPHVFPDGNQFMFWRGDGGWGDMEVVTLSKDLGRYFGTEEGLLVIRAPGEDTLKLRDGDVIRSIDGREPSSISHVVRILDSYQPGETLDIEIMRDKRKLTLKVEIPDNRRSGTSSRNWAVVGPDLEFKVEQQTRD